MLKIGPSIRKPLVLMMTLLAVIVVLSPAALRADACLDAFANCMTDVGAYLANPLHWMYCLNGFFFCLSYLPS